MRSRKLNSLSDLVSRRQAQPPTTESDAPTSSDARTPDPVEREEEDDEAEYGDPELTRLRRLPGVLLTWEDDRTAQLEAVERSAEMFLSRYPDARDAVDDFFYVVGQIVMGRDFNRNDAEKIAEFIVQKRLVPLLGDEADAFRAKLAVHAYGVEKFRHLMADDMAEAKRLFEVVAQEAGRYEENDAVFDRAAVMLARAMDENDIVERFRETFSKEMKRVTRLSERVHQWFTSGTAPFQEQTAS